MPEGVVDGGEDLFVGQHTSWPGLRDEDAAVVAELGLDDVLVEGLGVELVAGAALDGVREVAHDHVELLPALLQLSPASTSIIKSDELVVVMASPEGRTWRG